VHHHPSLSVIAALALAVLNPVFYPHLIPHDKTAVILDTFTATAYQKGAFYDYYCTGAPDVENNRNFCKYYSKHCDESCLTVNVNDTAATKTPRTLFYLKQLFPDITTLTDSHVAKRPELLLQFDRVIVLHNEYVTLPEFTAITHHPNVVYLFPNALYARVGYDKVDEKITLMRGHQYPDKRISNGFDWEFDNTQDEFNRTCDGWHFREIYNGMQLNCWPEKASDARLVEIMKSI